MNAAVSYFDRHVGAMAANREAEGIRALCYDQQAALLASLIAPGMTVLDVGCGPSLPYDTRRAYVIGIDPSAASLDQNADVDERLVGTAENIPLPDASVDLAVCFYSLHHIHGGSDRQTFLMRRAAYREMWRVLVPGGDLLVFEVSPYAWARRAIGLIEWRFDACFWSADQYRTAWPWPATFQTFDCSPLATFPPILSVPWLRVPRCLYPFDAVALRWHKEPTA